MRLRRQHPPGDAVQQQHGQARLVGLCSAGALRQGQRAHLQGQEALMSLKRRQKDWRT